MTFNAKNLSYEKQEPAFLRRLRAENPSEMPVARPRKPRLGTGDDEGPTIVDQQGETITEKEYQDMVRGSSDCAFVLDGGSTTKSLHPNIETQGSLSDATGDNVKGRAAQDAAVRSGPRKRKLVKTVATESGSERPEAQLPTAEGKFSDTKVDEEIKVKLRSRKKKIKLSFDAET